jgi:hypothetical protein
VDFQDTVGHVGMLLFGWGNSSVLNGRAKMLNVYEILSMQRVYEGKSFFRVAVSTSIASSPSGIEV